MSEQTLAERLETKADMINMGERIQWGSDQAIMREAAAKLRQLTDIVKKQHEVLLYVECNYDGMNKAAIVDEALALSSPIVKGVSDA